LVFTTKEKHFLFEEKQRLMSTGYNDDERVFQNLKSWIEKSGGTVHPFLHLARRSAPINSQGLSLSKGIRGLFTSSPIKKGELLLKIPSKLALSGEKLPKQWNDRVASPWLRCIACLYSAQGVAEFEPYLASLPSEYETLWQWEDNEIKYLDGTALGEILKVDRKEGSLMQRYHEYVQPYLRHLKIVGKKHDKNSQDALRAFRKASMCISTRGFHMRPPDAADEIPAAGTGKEPYVGPFLLPIIDLLNHNESNKATTLQRDEDTGDFYMKAERDIAGGEEIMHSYGKQLCAAQLLQTFGFVPENLIQQTSQDVTGVRNTTPAVFSKKDLVDACRSVKKSSAPRNLQKTMKDNEIEGEAWEVCGSVNVPEKRDTSLISDQILVTPSCTSGSCLSDEIVTLCCIQMLPDEVFKEIFDGDDPKLLGQEVLEDYFLGNLVGMAILTAVKTKVEAYIPLGDIPGVTLEANDDRSILQQLLQLQEHNLPILRAIYGITIRLEEKKALHDLRSEVISLLASLDDEDSDDEEGEKPLKKVKTVME
jgi:SET domain